LPKFFRKTFNNLISCDKLHISGGGNLNEFWHGHVLYRSLMINIASLYKIPIYISGQTVGYISNNILKRILSDSLKKVEVIGIRDKNISLNNLLNLGINKSKICFCPDDMLLLEYIKVENQIENQNGNKIKVGLSLHKFKEEKNSRKKIMMMLQDLKDNIPNILFFLIPHYYNSKAKNDDLEYMKEMLCELNIKNYTYPDYHNLIENKSFEIQVQILFEKYSEVDLVISTRYHGIVSALMTGVPAVAINLNEYYIQKNYTFYNEIGLDSKLFQNNLEDGTLENFAKKIKYILIKKSIFTKKINIGINKLKKIQNNFYAKLK
jgi:polysaccharide pyruvyl transferase WcaK-like protein